MTIKVRYVGDYYKVYLKKGEVYEADLVDGFYRIYDEDDGQDYGYPPEYFEVVEG
jgi:hypothetical protein